MFGLHVLCLLMKASPAALATASKGSRRDIIVLPSLSKMLPKESNSFQLLGPKNGVKRFAYFIYELQHFVYELLSISCRQ